MAIMWQAVLLIQLCFYLQLLAQKDPCSVKLTCRDCIQTENCVWCSASDYSSERCSNQSRAIKCPPKDIYPKNVQSTPLIVEDIPFDDFRQVRPQRISLKMRVGQTHNLQVTYRQSQNYPVDLYYVMDLSSSMRKYKDELSALGTELAKTMKQLTRDFRLGFGSFVDKPTEPYVSKRWKSHCPLNIVCEEPYGFKHIMKLESNATKFKVKVKNAPLSVNIDWPEGGFDAIMQAVVCKEEIGWRNNARHLLIFSTDSAYHLAGDGKLGGIVEPNDMKCHLNKEGDYTHSLEFDYPSIGQIQQVLRDNNVYLIFVVTSKEEYIYRPLANHIADASLGFLDEKSGNNVAKVIKGIYQSITDKVVLNMEAAKDVVQLRFYSTCNTWSSPKETHTCTNVSLGHEVNFTATIKVVSCPKDESKWRQTVKIKPSGLNQVVIIDLEIIGKCECEGNNSLGFESNSKSCNSGGNKECGICVCDDNHYGENCRCEKTDIFMDTLNNEQQCRENNNSVICSGHGDCLCSRCECDKGPNGERQYSGKYCECDDFSCPRHNGLLCAGHGRCDCGACSCDSGWQGHLCNCPTSTVSCTPPDSDVVCSGRGHCECGVCSCEVNEKGLKYTGKYCEECPTCPAKRCDEFRPCVECKVFNSGTLSAQECLNCTIEILQVDYIKEYEDRKVCKMPDENCFLVFAYHTSNNSVLVQRTKECAVVVNALAMSLGMIGGIVLLGLLLLIVWKIITCIHDEKEFAKFESERSKSKFDGGDNPLYKGPTTTIQNPIFPGSENPNN